MRSWTIPPKFHNALAALALAGLLPISAQATAQTDPQALLRTLDAAANHGLANGWRQADEVTYFSALLDAGRTYELTRHDDPETFVLKGKVVDFAAKYNYDPLIYHDAAEWYVRLAAGAYADDPVRGPEARALLEKLDADDADPARLAQDADADATRNAEFGRPDTAALLEQVDADVGAYLITKDAHYQSLAQSRAAQPGFPRGLAPDAVGQTLWAAATKGGSGTAPADEYFGQTKLSPLGVRDALVRIGKYLDAGWGDRMTKDTLWVIDSLEDWQHQYPRDYELPRLLLQTYKTLQRIDSPDAQKAEADVRRTLTVEYNDSTEARSLLSSG